MSSFRDPRPSSWFDPPDPWDGATCEHGKCDEPIDEDSAFMEGDEVHVCESCAELYCKTHGVELVEDDGRTYCEECDDAEE